MLGPVEPNAKPKVTFATGSFAPLPPAAPVQTAAPATTPTLTTIGGENPPGRRVNNSTRDATQVQQLLADLKRLDASLVGSDINGGNENDATVQALRKAARRLVSQL